MKKPYEELELEVIRFTAEDVITASAEETAATEEPTTEEPKPAEVPVAREASEEWPDLK